MENVAKLNNVPSFTLNESIKSEHMTRFRINSLIFACLFIFTFAGSMAFTSAQSVIETESTHYYANLNYKNIVTLNGHFESDLVNGVVKAIDIIPYQLVNKLMLSEWKIVVVDGDASRKLGETIQSEKIIYIFNNGIYDGTTRTSLDTTMHELCHAIDCMYGLSYTDKFANLYQSEQNNFHETSRPNSEYHKTNKLEMFACVMTEFILHGEELKENNKNLYEYALNVWNKYCIN